MARAYAGLQYGATLQACFCHRSFCAADASTPVRRELLKNSTNKKVNQRLRRRCGELGSGILNEITDG